MSHPPKQIDNWDTLWMSMAYLVSMKSKDPSTKVGCVIVDAENNFRSLGFNGPPRDIDDTDPKIYQRPYKYLIWEHGERNAILNAERTQTPVRDGTLYINWMPCADCARAILQVDIAKVVIHKQGQRAQEMARGDKPSWGESCDAAMMMFQQKIDKDKLEVEWYDGPIIHRTFATFSGKHFQFCGPENSPRYCGCQCGGTDEERATCDLCTQEFDDN